MRGNLRLLTEPPRPQECTTFGLLRIHTIELRGSFNYGRPSLTSAILIPVFPRRVNARVMLLIGVSALSTNNDNEGAILAGEKLTRKRDCDGKKTNCLPNKRNSATKQKKTVKESLDRPSTTPRRSSPYFGGILVACLVGRVTRTEVLSKQTRHGRAFSIFQTIVMTAQCSEHLSLC